MLILITSIIAYKVERRKTLEDFSHYTYKIVHELQQYDFLKDNASTEQKINFLIKFCELDLYDWDKAYASIDFIFDFDHKDKLYIYNNLYQPLVSIENQIQNNSNWNFRWYEIGLGKDSQMDVLIKKIEDAIYETHEYIVAGSHDHYYTNKITSSVIEKLNGHYYVIMYGKRKAKKEEERIKKEHANTKEFH